MKSIQYYARTLHRNLGYLAAGFVIFFALSGIVLIYRDTDFMKHTIAREKMLLPDLSAVELASALKIKNLKVTGEDSTAIRFTDGTYSKTTGLAKYTASEVRFPFNKLISLHKSESKDPAHWFTTLFGIVLLLLAVTSFGMFNPHTQNFKRGAWLVLAGIVGATLLLFIV